MGIFKKAFVLCAIIAAVPLPAEERANLDAAPDPGTFAYISAASEVYADASGFCQRQPTVCATADYIGATMQAKAKYAARVIYEWTSSPGHHSAPAKKKAVDTTLVSTDGAEEAPLTKAVAKGKPEKIEDLMPELRGSVYEDQG